MSESTRGPLARWSERKLAAREARRGRAAPAESDDAKAGAEPEPIAPAAVSRPADAPQAGQGLAENKDAPGEGRPALPSLDELDANSDYTQFLAKGVPEELTRAALRKLWHSDPVFAQMDGLDTYIQDFNLTDPVITAAQTSYKIGRGYFDLDESGAADDTGSATGPDDGGGESEQRSVEVAAHEGSGDPPESTAADRPGNDAGSAAEDGGGPKLPDNDPISKG